MGCVENECRIWRILISAHSIIDASHRYRLLSSVAAKKRRDRSETPTARRRRFRTVRASSRANANPEVKNKLGFLWEYRVILFNSLRFGGSLDRIKLNHSYNWYKNIIPTESKFRFLAALRRVNVRYILHQFQRIFCTRVRNTKISTII